MSLKIGVSACLLGRTCNFNGKDLLSTFVQHLPQSVAVEFVPFCPEDSVFGTPRANLRIVGGDGFDVLDGRAKVFNEKNVDVTDRQIVGAQNLLAVLKNANVDCAILMDGSPSCGSNVILKEEAWPQGGFKRGAGVACVLLKRNGIQVFSSFDERAVVDFLNTKFPDTPIQGGFRDLKGSPKFKSLFEG